MASPARPARHRRPDAVAHLRAGHHALAWRAAIRIDHLSSDVAGARRGQEHQQHGEVLRLADDGWHADLTRGDQRSHVLTSMLGAEALALIPAERETVPAGERVAVELLPRP